MKITLMGTGTSQGVPVIACKCPVCTSKDRHDKRLRCSALVENKNSDGTTTKILIDTGPEFRIQALKYKITNKLLIFTGETRIGNVTLFLIYYVIYNNLK